LDLEHRTKKIPVRGSDPSSVRRWATHVTLLPGHGSNIDSVSRVHHTRSSEDPPSTSASPLFAALTADVILASADARFGVDTGSTVAMLPAMLEHDRKHAGWSVGRAAWELGVKHPGVTGSSRPARGANVRDVGPDLQPVRLATDVCGSRQFDRRGPRPLRSASRSRWGLRVPAASHFLLDGLRSSDGHAPSVLTGDRDLACGMWLVGDQSAVGTETGRRDDGCDACTGPWK
jgi:hypothetical protein